VGLTEGKKIKGCKRHITTDNNGNILCVKVHAANTHDTKAGCDVLDETLDKYPNIKRIIADNGYRGTCVNYISTKYNKIIEISKKIKDQFAIQPIRWRVERTFSWLNGYRRIAKIFENSISSAENFIIIAHSMLLINRKN
jgi:putative transposase